MRLNAVFHRYLIAFALSCCLPLAAMSAEQADVHGRIELLQRGSREKEHPIAGNAVVWLSPEGGLMKASLAAAPAPGHFRMEQKNKSFHPHLLVVPLGSTVEFPNRDPFFHNVFSQFNGKRFDLGLYETGSTRTVHFDQEGVSYIFCNIHSQMAAVILTLRTPYFAVAKSSGPIEFHQAPAGDYQLRVWAEGADAKQLENLSRRVHIGPAEQDLGTIRIDIAGAPGPHKNKFGDDYMPDSDQSY